MASISTVHISSCSSASEPGRNYIDTLQNAMHTANSFFVKVHAGEDLALLGETEGVESTFLQLRQQNPEYATGATRVLARLYKDKQPDQWNACINLILDQYQHADSTHPRLVAIESLGKLGYHSTLPAIVQDAQTGTGGFRAMARWVLSNNGSQAGEDSLAALLSYPDVTDYRGAAYALRFKASVSDSTYRLLEQCVKRLSPDDPARVYVQSSLFVHTPVEKNAAVKKELLQNLTGPIAAKYEVAEALSIKGGTDDLAVLETLLKDPEMDVRVAAANAILKIKKREQ